MAMVKIRWVEVKGQPLRSRSAWEKRNFMSDGRGTPGRGGGQMLLICAGTPILHLLVNAVQEKAGGLTSTSSCIFVKGVFQNFFFFFCNSPLKFG